MVLQLGNGLNAEDIIVAVNNVALTEGFETIRQTLQPGEPVQITAGAPRTTQDLYGGETINPDHALLFETCSISY